MHIVKETSFFLFLVLCLIKTKTHFTSKSCGARNHKVQISKNLYYGAHFSDSCQLHVINVIGRCNII